MGSLHHRAAIQIIVESHRHHRQQGRRRHGFPCIPISLSNNHANKKKAIEPALHIFRRGQAIIRSPVRYSVK